MEKLTNEQKEAVLDAINGKGSLRDIFEDRLRRAGLLKPEETAVEMAKHLWEEWCKESAENDVDARVQGCFNYARQIIEPLFSEISRLNREAWDDGDMWWAYGIGNDPTCNNLGFTLKLLERRRQKGSKA